MVGEHGLLKGAKKGLIIADCSTAVPDSTIKIAADLAKHGITFVDTPMTARNDFPMPFIVSSEFAAQKIVQGLVRGRFEIAFPWQLVTILKLARILPYWLFFPIMRRALGL